MVARSLASSRAHAQSSPERLAKLGEPPAKREGVGSDPGLPEAPQAVRERPMDEADGQGAGLSSTMRPRGRPRINPETSEKKSRPPDPLNFSLGEDAFARDGAVQHVIGMSGGVDPRLGMGGNHEEKSRPRPSKTSRPRRFSRPAIHVVGTATRFDIARMARRGRKRGWAGLPRRRRGYLIVTTYASMPYFRANAKLIFA